MARFRRRRDTVTVVLSDAEASVLRDLVAQVDTLLQGGVPERGGDAVRERLFPRAYLDPTAEGAEQEWQLAVHEDLVREKATALAALVDGLDSAGGTGRGLELELDPEATDAWVRALNDLRLSVGVILGVTEDGEEPERDDPLAELHDVYRWLTHLQGELVEALLAREGDG